MAVTQTTKDLLLTVPNAITLARVAAVPVLGWLMVEENWVPAFWLFLIAGLSDAVDGIIARFFGQSSRLGQWLDPLADKALLVTAFVALAIVGLVPAWLVILAVGRDVLIVSGVLVTCSRRDVVPIRPLLVSKATTAAQIALIAVALGGPAFDIDVSAASTALVWATAALTVASLASYALVWFRHMTRGGAGHG